MRSDYDDLNFTAYGIFLPIVISLGSFGNMVFLAVLVQPRLLIGAVTQCFMVSLCVANSLAMLFCIPLTSYYTNIGHPHTYSAAFFHAHLSMTFVNTFLTTTVFIVVLMTLDRFLCLKYPLTYSNGSAFRTA